MMIKLKIGEIVYQKKATTLDTLTTLKTLDRVNAANSEMGKIAEIQIEYAVELFGNQGLTAEDILNTDASKFSDIIDQLSVILNQINGAGEDTDEVADAKPVDPKKQ